MRRPPGVTAAIRRAKAVPRRFRHVAIVLDGPRVLAYATNRSGHAEVAALGKAWWPTGATVVSLRVGGDGRLKMARPCDGCMGTIRLLKTRAVIYSTAAGSFEAL